MQNQVRTKMGADAIKLEVINGLEDGKIFEFRELPVSLGRHQEDNLCLPFDSTISRHHAQISLEGDIYILKDVGREGRGSTNGTFLNGTPVIGQTTLLPGDIVQIGGVLLKFDKES
jgi:pSer/pThr/pTyr-binding forkhead associated (FHA) protein